MSFARGTNSRKLSNRETWKKWNNYCC